MVASIRRIERGATGQPHACLRRPSLSGLDLIGGLSAPSAQVTCAQPCSTANLFDKLLCAPTRLGHQAVVVFFVLSGLFVGGSVLRAGEDFRNGWYAVARLARLPA